MLFLGLKKGILGLKKGIYVTRRLGKSSARPPRICSKKVATLLTNNSAFLATAITYF